MLTVEYYHEIRTYHEIYTTFQDGPREFPVTLKQVVAQGSDE